MQGWRAVGILALVAGAGFFVGRLTAPEAATTMTDDLPLVAEAQAQPTSQAPVLTAASAARASETALALETLAASLPLPEMTTGDGVLRVTVRDAGLAPVEGVRVRVLPADTPPGLAQAFHGGVIGGEPTLEAQLAFTIRSRQWRDRSARFGTTNSEGLATIEGLAEVDLRVSATKDGWRINRSRSNVRAGAKLTLTLTASPMSRVRFEIEGPPLLAGSKLEATFSHSRQGNASSMRRRARPDPAGGGFLPVDVAPGSYEVVLSARTADGLQLKSAAQAVEVPHAGDVVVVRATLGIGTMLRGRYRWSEQGPVAGVNARLLRLPEGVGPSALRLQQEGEREGRDREAAANKGEADFAFEVSEPGRYMLGVSHGGSRPIVAWREIDLVAGLNEHDLDVPALTSKDFIAVRVVGPDGPPAQGPQFTTGYHSSSGTSYGGTHTVPRPDGVTWVFHNDRGQGGARDGTYWLAASLRGLGTQGVTYNPESADVVELRFAAPAKGSGEIAGVGGSPYAGRVHVRLTSARAHGSPVGTFSCDAQGRFVLAGVQPGAFDAAITIGGQPHSRYQVAVERIELRSGVNQVRLTMPTLYVLRVRGGAGHVYLSPQQIDGRPIPGRSRHIPVPAAGETADLDGLPAGTYRVQSGKFVKIVTLPGTSEVNLDE